MKGGIKPALGQLRAFSTLYNFNLRYSIQILDSKCKSYYNLPLSIASLLKIINKIGQGPYELHTYLAAVGIIMTY